MRKEQRRVFVYNKTRETFLAFRVKVADSILGRLLAFWGEGHSSRVAVFGLCQETRYTP